jgi:hypothetical protein
MLGISSLMLYVPQGVSGLDDDVEKNQFSLQSDKNIWYFTRRPMYMYHSISINPS